MSDIYRSATLKLTAWYLALVMAISIVFSGVVYHFAMDALTKGLSRQQARIYKEFPVFSGNPFFVRASDITAGSHAILFNLFYFNLAVLVAAGFASYWLARRTLQPIEASNEQQRRFVADASHELRTPLTALKMGTEVALLDKSAPKDDLRAALTSGLEEATRLEGLLDSLLRLSQLETNGMIETRTVLLVRRLTTAAIGQTSQRAQTKHITVAADGIGRETVMGDGSSLVQLLVILLDNAIKYSPDGASVTVSATAGDATTSITVSDHGIGIEPQALTHIFDRFYRADQARSGNSGYGLGLSIAKHIADLHDGTITITSTPGKGTTARLSLPS